MIVDIDDDGNTDVIYASWGGYVVCVAGDNGSTKWTFLAPNMVYSSLTAGDVDGDGILEILFGCYDTYIHCLNGKTGLEKWKYKTGGAIDSSPAIGDVDGDEVYDIVFGSNDRKLYCIDGKTHAFKWSITTGNYITGSPAIGNLDLDPALEVVVGSFDNIVYCVDGTNGASQWNFTTPYDVIANPAIVDVEGDGDNEIIIPSSSGIMYCLYGNNGSSKWSFSAGNVIESSPAVADIDKDGTLEVVFGCVNSRIYSLNAKNGTREWDVSTGTGNEVVSSPAIADVDGDTRFEIVVGTKNNKVVCLSGENGSQEWAFPPASSSWASSSPTIGDVDNDGKLEIVVGFDDLGIVCLVGNGLSSGVPKPWPCWGKTPVHQACTVNNDYTPVLSNDTVTPPTGSQVQNFNFTVKYTDADNNFPVHVNVTINGTSFKMNKTNASDKNYTDGCLYTYCTTLPIGSYVYSFKCSDGLNRVSTTPRSGPTVAILNNFSPVLSEGMLYPPTGFNSSTSFKFSVKYTDADNNPPQSMTVTINSSTYVMTKENSADNNYADGCIYMYSRLLSATGNYTYHFNCSDGIHAASLGPLSGPSVGTVYLKNYYRVYEPYSWIDASDGIRCNLAGMNDASQKFYLPFVGHFYNKTVDQIYVCTNGFASFVNDTSYSNVFFPSSAHPLMIAPYWDNLKTTSPCNIYVKNLSSPKGIVVQWDNIATVGDRLVGSFQLVFYESGEIIFNYDYIVYISAPTCGLNFGPVSSYYNLYTGLNASVNHFSMRFTLEPNTHHPALKNGSASPMAGTTVTPITFNVNYTDQDNNAPRYVNVVINGSRYAMAKILPGDANYVDGCNYSTTLALQPGNYLYYFECADFLYSNNTISYTGPTITEINANSPVLASGDVSPHSGYAGTSQFVFSIVYSDLDNNEPGNVQVLIDSAPFLMAQYDTSDSNFTDGCTFTYTTILDVGTHEFLFNCSDGLHGATFDPGFDVFVKENVLRNYTLYTNQPYSWIDMATGTKVIKLSSLLGLRRSSISSSKIFF